MNHKEEMDVAFENCLTYLRRRGRLPFRAASFGPVDNLILSLCAYDPFEWVLPGVESGVWLPFSQAETLSELSEHWADTALAALGAYRALPPETRRDMLKYIWRFLRNLSTGGKAHPHRLH